MNYKLDLPQEYQELLKIANVKVENKESSPEEVKRDIVDIGSYIMSKSSKNGDIAKTQVEFMPVINVLQRGIV